MSLEGLGDIVSLEVLGGVSSYSDIVVIDDKLDVETLGDRQSGRLRVISFLLGAIGAQTEDGFVLVGKCDTIDKGPASGELRKWTGAEISKTSHHMCPRRPDENLTPGVKPNSG